MAELKIKADSGGGTVSLKGPATTTLNAAVQLTLPVDDGAADQYLKTDGSGALSWSTVSAGTALTGSTNNTVCTVTGADAIQGESNFTYDGKDLAIGVTGETGWASDATSVQIGGCGAIWGKTAQSAGAGIEVGYNVYDDNSVGNAYIVTDEATKYRQDDGDHFFYAAASGSADAAITFSERLKIFNAGGISLDGASKKESAYMINIPCDPGSSPVKKGVHFDGDGAGSGQGYVGALFTHSDSAYGNISWSTSGTVYSTSSDYRMKENVVNLTGAIDRVKNFKPYRFNFKEDKDKTVDGFLAHEAATVVPEAVTGAKDATETRTNFVKNKAGKLLDEGVTEAEWTAGKAATPAQYPADSTWGASEEVPIWQSIDQSKIVPLLTAALQEAITKIETLETKVAALEAG